MSDSPNLDCKELEVECRALIQRYALVSAGSSAVPLPALDIAVDLFNMQNCLNTINKKFGLSEDDIAGMPAHEKVIIQSLLSGGATFLGQKITAELIKRMAMRVGVKVAGKQFTKFIPFIGPAISATIGYTTFSKLCNQHVDDCLKASRKLGRCRPVA